MADRLGEIAPGDATILAEAARDLQIIAIDGVLLAYIRVTHGTDVALDWACHDAATRSSLRRRRVFQLLTRARGVFLHKPLWKPAIAGLCLALGACGGGLGDDEPVAAFPVAPSRAPTPTPAPASSSLLVPAQGVLLGHYYGAGTIAETDARIGRRPQVHLSYYGWADHWALTDVIRQDLREGRIPLVNWEPEDIDFKKIVDGSYDDLIRSQADEARALNAQFFLDFAAEMNEEEGWGGHDPQLYISAWRHIHDIFVARGATNVVWVWCPNNVDSDGQPAAMRYYPGDAYVDWVGADGYNWGTSKAGYEWQSFEDVFADIYDEIVATGKPVMIGEMASDEVGGSKAEWIEQIAPTLKARFPAIKAVVWFDVDKERNWPIDSSAAALAAYQAYARDPYLTVPR